MTNTITSCKDRYERLQQSWILGPKALSEKQSVNEAFIDDGETIEFSGYNNKNQPDHEVKKWASETKELAQKSIYSHLVELPVEIISYFISKTTDENSLLRNVSFALERLAGTLGWNFRYRIYSRADDNEGATKLASQEKDKFGDTKTYWLTWFNNLLQSKVRFVIPLLALIKPDLANDVDRGFFEMIDSCTWRKWLVNGGCYPGVIQDILTKCKNLFVKKDNQEQNTNLPSIDFYIKQFKTHLKGVKDSWRNYKNTNDENLSKEHLLGFCKNWDKLTSIIMPVICLPSNLIGDTLRPIARTLGIKGFLRNLIRVGSVADRSILGINYFVKYFLPERIAENEQIRTIGSNKFRFSNLYLVSLIGDVLDLPLTVFEDKIKESNILIQHSIEVMRIVKDNLYNIFMNGRRIRIAEETLKT